MACGFVCVDVCCMRADGDAKRLDVVTEMRDFGQTMAQRDDLS